MPRTTDSPPDTSVDEQDGETGSARSPERRAEATLDEAMREVRARFSRDKADWSRDVDRTSDTVAHGTPEESTRVETIDTEAGELIEDTRESLDSLDERNSKIPLEFRDILQHQEVQDFFSGLSLHDLDDPDLLKQKFVDLFRYPELCKELGIDTKYSESLAGRYAFDLRAKGEQYLREEMARKKGAAGLTKQLGMGALGGARYAALRRGAELVLKIGTTAALPLKMGVGAGVGAVDAALTYSFPRLAKRFKKSETKKAAEALDGDAAVRTYILDQLQADLAYDIGFDRDRVQNIQNLRAELRAMDTDQLTAMFGEDEGDKSPDNRRRSLQVLLERTENLQTSRDESTESDVEARQELIKKLLDDGTLERYATAHARKAIEEMRTQYGEGALDENTKSRFLMDIHIMVEQRMNAILGDVVAQEKFAEIDDASKKSFAETALARVMGHERPESFVQAVIAGGARGAVAGAAHSDYLVGTLYMAGMGLQSGLRQEIMGRRERIVKTPKEITEEIHALDEKVRNFAPVNVTEARDLIRDARARIKLPDIQGPDRARIETEIAMLEQALVWVGFQGDLVQANEQDTDALVAEFAQGALHERGKSVSRAAELARRERKATSIIGLGAEFWKLSRKEKRAVWLGAGRKAAIGAAAGLSGGFLAGEIFDGIGVSAAHAMGREDAVEAPRVGDTPRTEFPHLHASGADTSPTPDAAPAGSSGTAGDIEAGAGAPGAPEAAPDAAPPDPLAEAACEVEPDATPDQLQALQEAIDTAHIPQDVAIEIFTAHPELIDNPNPFIEFYDAIEAAHIPQNIADGLITDHPELIQNLSPIIDVQTEMDSAGLNSEWVDLVIAHALIDATPEGLENAAALASQIGEGFAALDLSGDQRTELIVNHADVAQAIIENPELLSTVNTALDTAGILEASQGEVLLAHPEFVQNPAVVTDLATRFETAGISDATLTELLADNTMGDLSNLDDAMRVKLLEAGVEKDYAGVNEEHGYTVTVDASGTVHVEMDVESEKSLGEQEQIYAQLAASRFEGEDLLAEDGKLSDIGAAKIINVSENLVNLTNGHGLSSLAEDFAKAGVTFEDGKLVIADMAAWNHVVGQLIERANGNEEALMSGAVAYIDNYSAETWDEVVALYGAKAGATLEVPEFSKYPSVQRAEQQIGRAEVRAAFGDSVDPDSIEIVDENTASCVVNGQAVEIRGGSIVSIGDLRDVNIDVTHFQAEGLRGTVQATAFEAQVRSVVGADAGSDDLAAAREVAAAVHGGSDILFPRELSTVKTVHGSGVSVETLKAGGDDIDDDLVGVVEKHPGVTDTQMKEIAHSRDVLREVAPSLSADSVHDMLVNEHWKVIPHKEDPHTVMLYNERSHSGLNVRAAGGGVEATYAPHAVPESAGGAEVVQSVITEKPITETLSDLSPRALSHTVNAIEMREGLEQELAGEVDSERRDSGVFAFFKRELKVPEVEKFMRDVTVEDLQHLDSKGIAEIIGTNQSDDVKDVVELAQATLAQSKGEYPDGMSVGEALSKALAEQAAAQLDATEHQAGAPESGAHEATPEPTSPSLRAAESAGSSLRGGEADEAISPEPAHETPTPEATVEGVGRETEQKEEPGSVENDRQFILNEASDGLGRQWTLEDVASTTDADSLSTLSEKLEELYKDAKAAIDIAKTDAEKSDAQDLSTRAQEVRDAVTARLDQLKSTTRPAV
ncbi:MAG: hypothetical protein HYV34_03925 [Candidatus Kerfeldbacteria bacterium]|nr:hypothetical protein [Candidatus Kerfeldbacteria bacterium]